MNKLNLSAPVCLFSNLHSDCVKQISTTYYGSLELPEFSHNSVVDKMRLLDCSLLMRFLTEDSEYVDTPVKYVFLRPFTMGRLDVYPVFFPDKNRLFYYGLDAMDYSDFHNWLDNVPSVNPVVANTLYACTNEVFRFIIELPYYPDFVYAVACAYDHLHDDDTLFLPLTELDIVDSGAPVRGSTCFPT